MPTTPDISERRRGPQRVYILHPFRGQGRPGEREANKAKIADICRAITRMGHIPISPIHALSFLDDTVLEDRQDAIRLCRPLIEMADTVWAYIVDNRSFSQAEGYGLKWVQSEGCRADHSAAQGLGKPITYHVYEPAMDCAPTLTGV